ANQTHLLLGGHPLRADPDRHRLWHELRPHARTALAGRLPLRTHPHGRRLRQPVPRVQTPRMALTVEPAPSEYPSSGRVGRCSVESAVSLKTRVADPALR